MEKKIQKVTLILLLITALSKVLGFGREIITGSILGANGISDAYNLSLFIPNFFALIVQQTISIAFVPIYIGLLTKESKKSADSFANKLLIIILFIFSLFSILLFFFSDVFVSLFGSGLSEQSKVLASQFLRIGCWSLVLQTFVLISSSRLQALKYFIPPALTGFALDISCLVFLLISKGSGNYSLLGLIPVVSLILQCLLLIPFSIKKGLFFSMGKPFFDENIKRVFKIVIPAFFAVGIHQINLFVDKNIASNIVEGGISSLSYSQNILNIFQSLMIVSVITPLYSSMSEYSAKNEDGKLNDLLRSNIDLICFILVPISFILFFYSKEIVTIIYSHGAFDKTAVTLTSSCLRGYSFSLTFVVVNTLLTRYMYSKNRQKMAILFSGVSLVVNVILNLCVYKFTDLGVGGIAWATCISTVVNTALLLIFVWRKTKRSFRIGNFWGIVVGNAVAFFAAFSLGRGIDNVLPISNMYVKMMIGTLFFVIFYFAFIASFDKGLVESVKKLLKKTFTKRRPKTDTDEKLTIKYDPTDSSNQ